MFKNKSIFYKLMIIIIILSLIFPSFCITSIANSSDYSLSDAKVKLDGKNDGEVEISLVTETGGNFYALDGRWNLSESETTNYFSLSELKAGGKANPVENSSSTGKVYWADSSFTGFNVAAKGKIWTAKYKIDKDTPSGTYTIGLKIDAITGGTAGYNSDENFLLNATVKVTRADDPLVISFVKDEGVSSVDIYYTQDYNTANENDVTITKARNGETGLLDNTGSGQVNFKVNLNDNYLVDKINISGNYESLKGPKDTGTDNVYCITKVAGDLTISIKTKERVSIVPEISGYKASYEYTGNNIEPDITVNIYGTDTKLMQDVDYKVTYGTNKDLGTGTIYISSISSSDYVFANTSANFSIVKKELKDEDVTVPATVTYTGSELRPEVVVYTNNTKLTKDVDYEVTYTNQNGTKDEYVSVKIEGIGNYKGTIIKNVLITPKPSRKITPIEDMTITYGDTKSFEKIEGVTYTTNNENIVSIDSSNKLITVGAGEAIITVTYEETNKYAETSTTFKVKVEKAELTIKDATVSNKKYDGNTDAKLTSFSFEGIVEGDIFEVNTDYIVAAKFINANVGENKDVQVSVELKDGVANNYKLTNNIYNTKASITVKEITKEDVLVNPTTYIYDGIEKEPTVTVEIDGKTLIKNTDYTVEYLKNTNAGKGSVVVTGINNYNGEITETITINKKEITPVIEEIQDLVYNGEEQETELIVKDGDTILKEDIDYKVTYSENIDAGTATAIITKAENGNYNFEAVNKTFKIVPYTIKDADVSLEYTAVRYNGKAKEPIVTVTVNGKTISEANYSVEYSKNTEIGIADVTINGISKNYTGKIEKHFEIEDKEVLIINGIENNQKTIYTGEKVKLVGELKVLEEKISPSELNTNWYNENGEEIDQPIEVGSYMVTYSYSDEDYIGSLSVNFEIIKAKSILSEEIINLKANEGVLLSTIELSVEGLVWKDGTEKILAGNNKYLAIYTEKNDTKNYTTETIQINIYGYSYIDITTKVNGIGGEVSAPIENVLEGTEQEIIFTPEEIYEIDTVTVNGKETKVTNNKLIITAEAEDLSIVVTYKKLVYKYTEGANQTYTIDKDKTVTFRIDADFALFKDIYMDGNLVDPSNYTVKSGSTIITFNEEYLESLGEGTHTMTVKYSNGVEAETAFKIAKAESKPISDNKGNISKENKTNSPKTGDNIIIYVILSIISVVGILTIVIYRIKKASKENQQ